MIEWSSNAVIQWNEVVYTNLTYSIVGVYTWEFIAGLYLAWEFIRGRRKAKWPMVPFFLARTVLLGYLIETMIFIEHQSADNCTILHRINLIIQDVAIALASVLLLVRSLILVDFDKRGVALAAALVTGYVGVAISGATAGLTIPSDKSCIFAEVNKFRAAIPFIYGAAVDVTAFILFGWISRQFDHTGSSLFRDEAIFFIIPIMAKIAAIVLRLLDLNPIINRICDVPCAVTSVIAASWLVVFVITRRQIAYEAYCTKVKKPTKLWIEPAEELENRWKLPRIHIPVIVKPKHARKRSEVRIQMGNQEGVYEMTPIPGSSKGLPV